MNNLIADKCHTNEIKHVMVDGNKVTGNHNIAESFCDYFSNIASKLTSDIPPSSSDPIDSVPAVLSNSFFLTPVSENEIIEVTRNLNNSSYGLFNVPARILKVVISYVSTPLCAIINDCISLGVFSDILKHADVCLLYTSDAADE